MDNPENSLIVASTRQLPTFELNVSTREEIAKVLANSALIAKVTDRDSKIIAVRAQQELKGMLARLEKARKELKEPILIAGRKLDSLVETEKLPIEKEFGRVSNVVAEFDAAERRRVLEEERLQREELERIEREKQAELKRIDDEQAAKEAEAARQLEESRKALAAAARLAEEAKSKKQREAAEAARQDALRQEMEIKAQRERLAAEAAARAAKIEEKAGDAAYIAAKPIEATHVAGQRQVSDWEITKLNEWQLARARPDLVRKLEFDMRAIKDELKRGVKLPGVEAREVWTSSVRAMPSQAAINV